MKMKMKIERNEARPPRGVTGGGGVGGGGMEGEKSRDMGLISNVLVRS